MAKKLLVDIDIKPSLELLEILAKTRKHLLDGRRIKYVNFDADNRDGEIWRVVFRHWGHKETVFTNTGRPVEERTNLFEEIMEWLQ